MSKFLLERKIYQSEFKGLFIPPYNYELIKTEYYGLNNDDCIYCKNNCIEYTTEDKDKLKQALLIKYPEKKNFKYEYNYIELKDTMINTETTLKNSQQDDFQLLSGRQQILKRPGMWIGTMDNDTQNMFVIFEDNVEYKEVTFIPAFRKIIDEILDNSIDAIIKYHNAVGAIKVNMSDNEISIEDNGPGIPVVKKQLSEEEKASLPENELNELKNSYIPQIAWTRLFSGTNFKDSDDKTTIGSHGLGSKCASIFSTKFIGYTDDGKNACTVTAINNLESSNCKLSKSKNKPGTKVTFYPDFGRFNLTKVDQIYKDLMYQRLTCLGICYPEIKFYFNDKQLKVNDKKFVSKFSENIEFSLFNGGFIGIYPNEFDDFKFFSYVNGLHIIRGGTHVDYIMEQLVTVIRNKLIKSYKNIKPADIKNKLTLVLFMRDFPNLKFDSQTKETVKNSRSEISNYFMEREFDFEKFGKQILKNNNIIDPIIDIFKMKEQLKTRQELSRAKKVKVVTDKYMPPIGNKKEYLALCEGNSAMSGVSAALGRQGIGYYAMRGLPINAYDSSLQRLAANQEFKDITNILGLDISHDGNKTIDFDHVLITSDNDLDGNHITSMLIGWFKKFTPNLFTEGKICKLITPLIIIVDKNDEIKEYFFNLDDFKIWESNNKNTKNKIIYLKGLGSWDKEKLIGLIDKEGLDKFILNYRLDEKSEVYIEDWLGSDAEPRKNYLRNYTLDINLV